MGVHAHNTWLVANLPRSTQDRTHQGFFSRPFTLDDIAWAKRSIRKHKPHSAKGMDRVSYSEIAEIPNDGLLNLYRLIGLESCLLKVLTLLIDKRFREWALACNIIPDSQNGFQAEHRTNDNSFVLRCAIDRARAEGKTLHVVFIDLKNAFPSTDLATLWAKLYRAGASGPLFD
ncbi:hypothetical protein PLICRDRAFT_102359, partial [Plicaturopsis crispa FD-325 SS-3]